MKIISAIVLLCAAFSSFGVDRVNGQQSSYRVSNAGVTTWVPMINLSAYSDIDCTQPLEITLTRCSATATVWIFNEEEHGCHQAIDGDPATYFRPGCESSHACVTDEVWLEFGTAEPALCIDAHGLGKSGIPGGTGGASYWNGGISFEGPDSQTFQILPHDNFAIAVLPIVSTVDDTDTTDPGSNTNSNRNGAFGDPHFKTWNGKQFDFHGLCDLVLASNPKFGNGVGLDVHIRTKKTRQWSYVGSAAARIGDDILEVRGGKNSAFWINGVQGNVNTDELAIANYQIKYKNISETSKKFVVDLGDGEGIIFNTWNSFVSVQIENPKHKNFVGSVGLMGSFPEGLRIGRTNSIVEDFNMFGQEWQVLSTERNLFHNIEGPQHPQKCEIPSSIEMRRRLAASLVTFEEAEKACIGADSDDKELCIFDVMATDDLSSAGVY